MKKKVMLSNNLYFVWKFEYLMLLGGWGSNFTASVPGLLNSADGE